MNRRANPSRRFDLGVRTLVPVWIVAWLLHTATAAGVMDGTISSTNRVRSQAASLGDAQSTRPVVIPAGHDIQTHVDSNPEGTVFLLKAGLFRLQTIRPKQGNTFIGEGAVLSGARQLTAFVRSGPYWMATMQTQQGQAHGQCEPGYSRCDRGEQLFIDHRRLQHVGRLEEVGPGTWFFDYEADSIYFADDPTGRLVETSVTPTAFAATADDVTLRGLIVEKYANPAQHGAVSAAGRLRWTLSSNEVRWNHGLGIAVGSGARVIGNHVHHNGQLGIGGGWGSGVDIVIDGNEIAYNNTAGFDASWEAGGAKFAGTTDLVVRNNYVHHNNGPGLWTDTDNVNTLYDRNISDDNARMGILHEISYAAVIRDNTVRRNGFGFPNWIWGAGILVASSPDVEISGNWVEENADGIGAVQQARGSGPHGPYQVRNLHVHDNVVRMSQGWTGMVQDVGDTTCFTSCNNRFEQNRYHLGLESRYFNWMNFERSESEWRSYKLDVGGTFER